MADQHPYYTTYQGNFILCLQIYEDDKVQTYANGDKLNTQYEEKYFFAMIQEADLFINYSAVAFGKCELHFCDLQELRNYVSHWEYERCRYISNKLTPKYVNGKFDDYHFIYWKKKMMQVLRARMEIIANNSLNLDVSSNIFLDVCSQNRKNRKEYEKMLRIALCERIPFCLIRLVRCYVYL